MPFYMYILRRIPDKKISRGHIKELNTTVFIGHLICINYCRGKKDTCSRVAPTPITIQKYSGDVYNMIDFSCVFSLSA